MNRDIKQEFLDIYNTHIKRDGSESLLKWLEESDFFTAPASGRYHLAEETGLVQHSINVYKRFRDLLVTEYGEDYVVNTISEETVAIIGLLHDICKVNFYTKGTRNVKNEATGQWEKVEVWNVDEKMVYGHGSKSVYILMRFIYLTHEEATAIRFHMGGFEYPGTTFVEPGLTKVYNEFPLTLMIHLADMQACYLDEVYKGDK